MDSMSCYRKLNANPAIPLVASVLGMFVVEDALD
jgi:hypothetical protein